MTKFQCGVKFDKTLKHRLILIEIFETQAHNVYVQFNETKIMLDYEHINLAPVYHIPAVDENLDLSIFLYFLLYTLYCHRLRNTIRTTSST